MGKDALGSWISGVGLSCMLGKVSLARGDKMARASSGGAMSCSFDLGSGKKGKKGKMTSELGLAGELPSGRSSLSLIDMGGKRAWDVPSWLWVRFPLASTFCGGEQAWPGLLP
jgi:hypothetical protein